MPKIIVGSSDNLVTHIVPIFTIYILIFWHTIVNGCLDSHFIILVATAIFEEYSCISFNLEGKMSVK